MDTRQLWQTTLDLLQTRLAKNAFDNWLRPTRLIEVDDDIATIAAPNTFSAATLQGRYAIQVERALAEIVGRPIQVLFSVPHASGEAVTSTPERTSGTSATQATARSRGRPAAAEAHVPGKEKEPRQLALAATTARGLNPRYLYATYVVGSSNRFAHAASLSVADHPGGKFNPFFVHGGVGLGKTHLLHAMGHRALELNAELTVVYVSSETFTNDLINAIRAQRMEEFRARYRTIDILMIDDIQFIAGKESTQEEFFHTFNTLYQSGKQVIITSDKPPKAIAALEERLRSRFEGGLIADVQFPDYEMRTAILRGKGEEMGVGLPADVAEYIAQKDQTNIRELEGALNKVLALSQITDRPLSLDLAMEALTDAAIGERRTSTTTAAVLDTVAGHYKVTRKELSGRMRTKEIVLPRQVAMYLLREETASTLVEIGQALGDRDHTTIMHGIEKIERALGDDAVLRTQVMAIREALFSSSRR
ncbi:MAG: chromosomal replication initiator protein DnaA [Chloroflexota bacterium]|nr:chromosomal replication initiator protein DnaA [Chloroflexota bacterium]